MSPTGVTGGDMPRPPRRAGPHSCSVWPAGQVDSTGLAPWGPPCSGGPDGGLSASASSQVAASLSWQPGYPTTPTAALRKPRTGCGNIPVEGLYHSMVCDCPSLRPALLSTHHLLAPCVTHHLRNPGTCQKAQATHRAPQGATGGARGSPSRGCGVEPPVGTEVTYHVF